MSVENGGTAERLHTWLTREVHYQPQGKYYNTKVPDAEALRRICRGQAADIWKFVVSRVYSAETVKKVKGNLALKTQGYKTKDDVEALSERHILLQKKRALLEHIASAQSATQQVECEIKRLVTDISKTEQQTQEQWQRSQDMKRKMMLLQVSGWHLGLEMKKMKEYETSIQHRADVLLNRSRNISEKEYMSKTEAGNQGVMETSCTKQVRECCTDITHFLQELFKGNFNDDRNIMQRRRDGLWRKVELIEREYSPVQVVLSLTNLAQENAVQLNTITANISIAMDIKRLKFKFENGRLQDESTEPCTLLSVPQLLQASQKAHVMSFIEKEECRNSAFKYGERLEQALQHLHETLDRDMKDNPGSRDLAKQVINVEMHTASDRAAVRMLLECIADLQERVRKAAHDKELLYAKYQKIQHFRELTNQKQDVVRVLSKQNAIARHRLDQQQAQILNYAEKSLLNHELEMSRTSEQLHNAVSKEVEDFARQALPYLHYTMTQDSYKACVMDLSIHQLVPRPDLQSQTVQRVLQLLDFPAFKAPECLLSHVAEIHQNVSDIEATLRNQKHLAKTLEGQNKHDVSILDHIPSLYVQLQESDAQQEAEMLPKLRAYISKNTEALSHCLQLKDLVNDWWEQPAQNAVTWTTLDDQTFKEWKDRWMVAVTRLRQIAE